LCDSSAAEESPNDPVVYVYRASHYFAAKVPSFSGQIKDKWTNIQRQRIESGRSLGGV
jgi:alpha/beta superfamily hydrolase